ncbi:MAG TPA: cell wall-binding repeat-containing protein [Acidimicrobiales bacterium]|nr:cell wall-binding repeat-containing protein [Acidimicrobiales bacterium]
MMRHAARTLLATAGAVAAGAALAATPSQAVQGVTAGRLAGADRYATAAAVAEQTFPQGAADAIVVSGAGFADALSASYLAGRLAAPVLLTDPSQLPSATSAALGKLGVGTVDVVGGTAAVSDNVVSSLEAAGYRVARLSGPDRYGTAATVAQVYPSSTVGSLGQKGATAIVASGLVAADALAGSPISYAQAFPTLLTDPSTLPAATRSALSNLGIQQVLLLGGSSAVSAAVAGQLAAMNITVQRVGGADRTQTATMLADLELGQLGWAATHVQLARGDGFADALAGGTHAGQEKAAVLLTGDPNTLGSYTTAWLNGHRSTITSIHVLGGTAAVSDQTVSAAQQAAS